MSDRLSPRLKEIADALPLKPGIRVLEIGCATGIVAREILKRIGNGYVLGIDRSDKAIQKAIALSQEEIRSGRLAFLQVAIENFKLEKTEAPFDLVFGIRVGALDGRHPEVGQLAFRSIAKMLKPKGKFYIDSGTPLQEIKLDQYR
jgi:SAM-dependent methyltransferase